MESFLGLPFQASTHAAEIDHMMGLVHWLMLVLFIGWGGFFVFALFRYRASKVEKADYYGAKGKSSKYIEGAVALIEAVLLIGFSMPLWAERVNEFPPEGESTVVRVIGEQFAWNIHYPGADGIFGKTDVNLVDTASNPVGIDRSDENAKDDIITLNQMHVPVDKPVLIYLSSKDVIHSFSLNEMRVKQDAIPGLTIPVWFIASVTSAEFEKVSGRGFEIACAQLCGLGHYRMQGFLTVESQAEFDAWLAERLEAQGDSEDDFFN